LTPHTVWIGGLLSGTVQKPLWSKGNKNVKARDALILARRAAGDKLQDVALQVGLSLSRCCKIAKRAGA